MKPSTTERATSSRLPTRASTLGSTNLAPGTTVAALIWLTTSSRHLSAAGASHTRSWHGHPFQQPVDQGIARDAFGLRVEVRQDPVPQDRVRQRPDVLEAHVVLPARQRACLRAEHQVLRGADAG